MKIQKLSAGLLVAMMSGWNLGFAVPFVSAMGQATYVVTGNADLVDAVPGDGSCTAGDGSCTIRAAVMEANASGEPAEIVIPAGMYRLTIAPESVDPTLPMRLAGGPDRLHRALVNVVDASASGGFELGVPLTIRGAGARSTVIDASELDRVFSNTVGNTVTIADMTLTGGKPPQVLGTVSGGGAIWNEGHVTLRRVTLTGNHASYGGGLFNTPTASAVVDSSTISNNTVDSEGGGIRFDAAGTVINSTITGNRILPRDGAAFSNDGGSYGEGGGIDIRGGGVVDIVNSTITGNEAVIGGGGVNIASGYSGGPDLIEGGPLRLRNTIIAGNRSLVRGPANCKHTAARLVSLGHNLADDGSCELDAAGDRAHIDPRLGLLADNGGPTDTHALRGDSPARDAVVAIGCPGLDQRGVTRPRGKGCDIGSFER